MFNRIFVSLFLLFALTTNIHADTGFALSDAAKLDTLSPRVDNIEPNTVLVGENKVITITGKGFSDGIILKIGQWTAGNVNVNAQHTQLTATVPSGSKDTFDVLVNNPNGTSYTKSNGFTYKSPPASITITPSTATLTAGQAQQFDVSAIDADSQTVEISNTDVTWAVDGNIGTINEDGLFTAKVVGSGNIKATLKADASITAQTETVTVEAGALAKLAISQPPAQLKAGENHQFIVSGADAHGNEVSVENADVTWEVVGGIGSIDANGLFTAKKNDSGNVKATSKTNTTISAMVALDVQAGDADSVSLQTSAGTLTADGKSQATVTATVKDAYDNPVKAEIVGMVVTKGGGTLGNVQNNDDGTYTTTYTANTKLGEVEIEATTSNGKSGKVNLLLTPGQISSVQVSANPDELGADGVSQSTITVAVKDYYDNPIDNATVEMKTSQGNITSPAEHQSNGEHVATYTVGTEAGEVTVTATATSGGANVSGETKLTLTEGPALICLPNSGTVDEMVRLTGSNFIANEKAGKLTIGGEPVTIYAVGDTIVSENEIYADGAGEFVVKFVISKRPGGSVVLAVGDAETTLEIQAQISVSPDNGRAGTTITLTGYCFGENESILIDFGDTKNIKEVNSQTDGSFEATFQVDAQEPGEKPVVATGATSNISAAITFELTPTPETSLILEPTKGLVGTWVRVTGEGFEPSVDVGKLTINGKETQISKVGETTVIDGNIWTNEDGVFVVKFLVPKQPGGGVIVAVGDVKNPFVITAQIFVTPESGPAGTTVKMEGDGFEGEETVNVDFGDTKNIATGKTTPDGSFEVTFETDAQEAGTKEILVTGSLSERTAKTPFELISSEPATISIEANPTNITADGVSTSKLTITVKDANGYGVSRQNIIVTPDAGKVSDVLEQGGGIYLVTYTSDTKTGTVTISASTENNITNQTEITLKPGQPETVTVEANPDSLSADGSSQSIITATIKDSYGNPCTDEIVTMELSGAGILSNDLGEEGGKVTADEKGDGTYTATYTAAADKEGKAVIKASTENGKEAQTEISLSNEPNFVFSCNEPSQKVQLGKPLVYFIDGIGQNGFALPMKLSTEGLTKDVEWEFDPVAATPTIAVPTTKIQLKLSIPDTIEQGEYNFTVLGMNLEKGVIRHLNLSFTVQKVESDIYVTVTTKEIQLNESVAPSGNIILEKDDERTGMEVQLTYLFGDETIYEQAVSAQGEQREYTHEYVPSKVGGWKVESCWKGDSKYQGACRETFFTVLKGKSQITLSSSLESPYLGEKVTITGKLTPELPGEPISLTMSAPDDDNETKPLETDEMGVFRHEIIFDRKGDWTFETTWEGNDDYEASTHTLVVNAIKELGKAIVVLGGGNETTNRDWVIFNNIAEYVYNIFRKRHLTDDDIFFLSPSEIARNIIDKPTSSEWLEYAITKWAKDEKKVNKYVPLYIYLISHNTDDKFLLVKNAPNVYLTPEMLNNWLSVLPEDTPVIIVIEACYSGNFIEKLAYGKLGRIVITSARKDEKAELLGNKDSFSKFFFDGIKKNRDVLTAFLDAIETMSCIPQLKYQFPQLDANGDGVPMSPNEPYSTDKYMLGHTDDTKKVYIPDNSKSAGEAPEINWVTCVPTSLKETETKSTIRAAVSGLNINSVVASITSPAYDESQHSNWQPTYDARELFDAEGDGIYEAEYDEFSLPGNYTIVVNAENPEGDAMPKIAILTVEGKKTCPWDVNGDGEVDISDLVLVGINLGKSGANTTGDVNSDNTVDIIDLILVGRHFGETCNL